MGVGGEWSLRVAAHLYLTSVMGTPDTRSNAAWVKLTNAPRSCSRHPRDTHMFMRRR